MSNPYSNSQNVYITDPSRRLGSSGMTSFHFPYTPTITTISSSNYSSYDPSHTNFQQRAFEMRANTEITVAAPIVIESVEQGEFIDRAIHFFKGSMMINFGKDVPNQGMPPPVLRFFAHGIYTNVPVLVRDFTYNMDADVDYVEIGSGKRLPVMSNFVLSLTTTYSPKNVRENFSLDSFLSGGLRGSGYV